MVDTSAIELIVSTVGSLGFPIVCCIFMAKYINSTMKEFTSTMNENTKMLTRMCEKLDHLGGKSDDE